MDKYEKEYTLGEVLEMEEGTKLEVKYKEGFFASGTCIVHKTPYITNLIWDSDKKDIAITNSLYKAKFKLIIKEREVDVKEAMKAFIEQGKTIKAEFIDYIKENDKFDKTIFKPIKINEDFYTLEEGFEISPYMIYNCKWYIID